MNLFQTSVGEREQTGFRVASNNPANGLGGGRRDMNKTVKLSNKDRNILLRAPLLGIADDAAALRLIDAASVASATARHIIFKEGESAQHFYCVLTGYVRLYRLDRHGREADIRICGPGDTFNECLIFGSDSYRFNAQAAETTTLARFDLERIRFLVDQEPAIAKAIMRCLSNNALGSMECIANDRLQTAPQRVAHYLVTHGPRDAASFSLRLPFQKSLLAGKLGLAPEALSRAFSSLKKAGVTVRGRIVQVNDVAALKQI
ncbi:Crp/Fnr family transcriptional regulator [Rhizobium sp. RM]|nr:Crp/Fnr family transcriptional regulator [Rhizobium sp. RM]